MNDKVQGKIDKHYNVLVNGQKCKILNYKIEDTHLLLITKIDNPIFINCDDNMEICIEDEGKRRVFHVKWNYGYNIKIHKYYYTILEERTELKTNGAEQ